MCTNIINKFENIVYVGVIDKNTKLLVGKWKNIENDTIVAATSQSQFPNTYEIYNVLKNINSKFTNLKSDDFRYVIITKNKFKLIVIPLSDIGIKYICIFIIISNKSLKNLVDKILEFVI